jgi:chromate transporter
MSRNKPSRIISWLTSHQMLDGLALAETTPGPLIMVLQFVGFVGGWQHPGVLPTARGNARRRSSPPGPRSCPASSWIFLGAPHIEKLGEQPRLSAALTAITAAVVGVILNLGVKFTTHALWPASGGFDAFIAVLAIAAFIAMQRFKIGLMPVIGACATIGFVKHLAFS